MKKTLLLSLAILGLSTQARAQLVVNEIMQSNIDGIMDDLNEFPDSWVELYNSGDTPVNLADYKIGSKKSESKAWQLPSQTVNAHGYVVVYCDKEEKGLHTSFRLESDDAGSIYLFKNGETIEKEDYEAMPAPNIAYGRKTDGSGEWGYQATPTPGAANCGTVYAEILGSPVFSTKGKVFTSSKNVRLVLSLPEDAPEGTVIRYTTDGSEPTASSTLYSSPMMISSNRVIRAKLFCDGYLSPISTTQSYIFLGRDFTIPVISIVTDDRYLNDNAIGIIANNPNKDNKHDWRRPINFEYFDNASAASALNQLCETRVAGGQSREHALKTLVVYANKRFGTKRLEYEFFPEQKPGLTEFKSLMLRNAGNDFGGLYMRDAIIQRVMGQNADLDWQAWQPTVIFINGEYKGMLNIRERSNDDNIFSNYKNNKGKGLEDIDMVEISQENSQMVEELKTGTWDNYNAFKAFYHESGHTMAEYANLMDCYEFINLMAMNLYYGNLDFPGNNLVTWRPTADDGKWRWIAKDTDFGLGLYGRSSNYNTIEWINNPNYDSGNAWANTSEATMLFRNLMADSDFRREFIDRCAIYMGDFLNERGTREIWDPMVDLVKPELIQHRNLYSWSWWGSEQDIQNEINNARNWLSQRTNNFYTHIKNYYNLGTLTNMTVNKELTESEAQEIPFYFNGVKLTKGVFDGKFFQNRSVTLEGTAENGKKVTGWTITKTVSGSTTTTEVEGSQYAFTMPACTMLKINAITGIDTGINDVESAAWAWQYADGTLSVDDVAAGTRVCLYDLSGILVGQQTATGSRITFSVPSNRVYVLKVGEDTGVKIVVK